MLWVYILVVALVNSWTRAPISLGARRRRGAIGTMYIKIMNAIFLWYNNLAKCMSDFTQLFIVMQMSLLYLTFFTLEMTSNTQTILLVNARTIPVPRSRTSQKKKELSFPTEKTFHKYMGSTSQVKHEEFRINK